MSDVARAEPADVPKRTERERLLDPVDRISEVLFGLIMAVTIVGALSIGSAAQAEVRTVLLAAIGCNVAWGLVDAVMYVVRIATERARFRALGRRVREADAASGRHAIAGELPEHLVPIVGPQEIEAIRLSVLGRAPDESTLLRPRDFLEAVAIFAMVVLATFPVVLPFVFAADTATAFRFSQGITVVMLFLAGAALGRHAAHTKPWLTGLFMAVFGAVLIAAVKALGG